MTTTNTPKLVFGGFVFQPEDSQFENAWKTQEGVDGVLDILKKHNIDIIDTAQSYERSEEAIGFFGVGKKGFSIDTKHIMGMDKGTGTREGILKDGTASFKRLGVQIDVYYLHCPDTTIPIEDTLAGINDLYATGAFKQFGLSNFNAKQITEVIEISKSKGWILPTVYQGSYNAFSRSIEEDVIPLLHQHGIKFYAYSPSAGGLLTKTKEEVEEKAGKFRQTGGMIDNYYQALYNKPSILEGLGQWNKVAEKEGISNGELAYRWIRFNGSLDEKFDDAVLFGARSEKQLEETLKWLEKGPVSKEAAAEIDRIWEVIKDEAPRHNSLNTD